MTNSHKFDRPYKDMLLEHPVEKLALSKRIRGAIDSLGDIEKGVVFLKHMAKHEGEFDFDRNCEVGGIVESYEGVSIQHRHLLLVRDPASILCSWSAASANHSGVAEETNLEEVGIVQLMSIYSKVQSMQLEESFPAVVLDSDQLAECPSNTLSSLCTELGISYEEGQMMTWEAGAKSCDGPWAKYWYDNVHNSKGWNEQTIGSSRSYRVVPQSLVPILRASLPSYEFLNKLSCGKSAEIVVSGVTFEDPRNENILCWIGTPSKGSLVPRDLARISPFDSAVQGGDAVWEGLRIYSGKILSLERHLRRLFKSARAMDFKNMHTKDQVIDAIFRTLAANGMRDSAHIRLTLTRGQKITSSMNPNFNVYGTTLIVLAEWKPTEGATTYDNRKGVSLITAANRRNPPSCVDSKIHHNNLINNILPKIQANLAGAADAIMLDLDGFVSETNATNLFIVDGGTLITPHADHCLPGITRETIILLGHEIGIPVVERRVSLAEFHAADECFTTGTMGELTPVTMIDGRVIGTGTVGIITHSLQKIYKTLPDREGWYTPLPDFS